MTPVSDLEEWRTVPGWPEYEISESGADRRLGRAPGARCGRVLRT
jgi:hypothetical protein